MAYNTDSNDPESDDRIHLIEYISTGEHSIVGDSQFNRTGPRGGTVMHLGKAYQAKIIKSGTLEECNVKANKLYVLMNTVDSALEESLAVSVKRFKNSGFYF